MNMPFENAEVLTNNWETITIMDGTQVVCSFDIAHYGDYEVMERVAERIAELMNNHGANDDTSGMYDPS